MPSRSGSGFRVDRLEAKGDEPLEFRVQVDGSVGEVVHAGPAPGQETADRGLRPQGLEELDEPYERGPHALRFQRLDAGTLSARKAFVKTDLGLQVRYGDPDVVELEAVHFGPLATHGGTKGESGRRHGRPLPAMIGEPDGR